MSNGNNETKVLKYYDSCIFQHFAFTLPCMVFISNSLYFLSFLFAYISVRSLSAVFHMSAKVIAAVKMSL